MKYTEDNIIGVEFAENNKNNNLYKILRKENHNLVMAYLSDLRGYTFVNTIEITLRYMNCGIWKDFSIPKTDDSLINLYIL